MSEITVAEGWAKPRWCRRHHYFFGVDNLSLCRRMHFTGEREGAIPEFYPYCRECRRLRDELRLLRGEPPPMSLDEYERIMAVRKALSAGPRRPAEGSQS